MTNNEMIQEYKALIEILNSHISNLYNYRENHMSNEEIKETVEDIIYSELERVEDVKDKIFECMCSDVGGVAESKNTGAFSLHEISKPKFDSSQIRIDGYPLNGDMGLPESQQKMTVEKSGKIKLSCNNNKIT